MTRALALLLTLLTGFTGLVYEVTWQKYLAILLGSHAEATATVLAIFLGGLSVGYALFGRLTARIESVEREGPRTPRLLLVYGLVESSIGVWAFLFPFAFAIAQSLSLRAPVGSPALAFAFDVGLAALLIGPPSVLMGATIPVLTQALSRGLDDATRFHAFIYAFNTAGAFVGALAAGFFLVSTQGLVGTLQWMGALNLVAGAAFAGLALFSREAPASGGFENASRPSGDSGRVALYAAVVALNGFAMMTIQTTLIRLGGLAFGSSHFTFATVVAVFVLCIALGSFAVSLTVRIPTIAVVANQFLLAASFFALYGSLQDLPYWAHLLRSVFRDTTAGFHVYHFSAFVALALVLGLPVMLSGASLPLLFHHLRRRVGDLGAVAGRLYAWNTVGSLAGALVGGYLLFFWLDLHAVYRVAVVALIAAAGLLAQAVLAGAGRGLAIAVLVPALLVLGLREPWSSERLSSGLFRWRSPLPATTLGPDEFFSRLQKLEMLHYEDDPAMSIAVKGFPPRDGRPSRALFNNGKSDGAIPGDYTTMALASLLPALFTERVERGFVIGYGTGVTVAELAALESAREVTVAEISSGVMHAAPLFDYGNFETTRNPKVRVVRSDAFRALLRSPGDFDVIVSEPSNPWVTGVEMLYSVEFLTAARERLAPGGVFAQWVHTYELDRETLALVFRTYAAVFDAIAVWYAKGDDLILLGFADDPPPVDLATIHARYARPDLRAGFERAGIGSFAALLAHELLPLGVVNALDRRGALHTLLHPRLSDAAARAFYRGRPGEWVNTAHVEAARVGRANGLVRRLAERQGGALRPQSQALLAGEACRHRAPACAAILAEWGLREPDSQDRARILAAARQHPQFVQALSPATLAELSSLFDGDGKDAPATAGLPAAQRATDRFITYFNHAVPFERRALARSWDACEAGARVEACRKNRAQAEALLGPLQ